VSVTVIIEMIAAFLSRINSGQTGQYYGWISYLLFFAQHWG